MESTYYQNFLNRVFEKAILRGASDIHFSVGRKPTLRVDGKLEDIDQEAVLQDKDTRAIGETILTKEQYERFAIERELDFSYSYQGKVRFRANIFFQRGVVGIALRVISANVKSIEDLNLPAVIHQFSELEQGLVLFTGPAGHGKSTSMAAVIDEINHSRFDHIVTVEDPIEYLFLQDKCIIDQREVGQDTVGFEKALRSALRQDPDVILIGEMRDYRSISIALTAAETGHLIFSTLHTNSASQTIDRIIDTFPPEKQAQAIVQLAASLAGVVSQRLVVRPDGGRIPACEILLNNPAVSNIVRERRTYELNMVISTSQDEGMISLNRALANLYLQGKITATEAMKYSLDQEELRLMLH